MPNFEFPFTFFSGTGLPRIDFKLSIGEDPVFEQINETNAYEGIYLRLVYRRADGVAGLYVLNSTEVVDATDSGS